MTASASTLSVQRHASRALLICLAGAGLYHLYFHAAYTLDDAYISFRYARNLARGAGLTWNPGEYVKGYSNTLFTLLMALPELFGRDPIALAKALGVAAFALIVGCGVRSYGPQPAPELGDRALWFVLLCAASTSLAVHCMNGLETGFYAALLFAGVLRRVREQQEPLRPWSAVLLGAAVLSRPEGILLYAATALHDLIWRSSRRRWQRQDLVFYLVPPLTYALELWLSTRYYGVALPNTYYAKTAPVHGLSETVLTLWRGALAQLHDTSYLSKGMHRTGLGMFGLCATLPALFARRYQRRSWALFFVVLAQLVFIIRAGDDWAPAFRFGVPLLPPLFLLIADSIGCVAALARRYERPCGWALAAGLALLIVPRQIDESRVVDEQRYVNAANKLLQGAFFASLAAPGITLSSFDIGGQGYAAGGFDVLDTAGLTSRETVGCRRGGRRCARYAELIMPELVRLHSNHARDAFVSKTVVRHARYLTLDGGKYLLQRALVFPAQLPAWVSAETARLPLLAADMPSAVSAGAMLTGTLYFERRGGVDAIVNRRLAWRDTRGDHDAHATDSVLRHIQSQDEWHEGELFADRVTLHAPTRAGQYTLVWQTQPAQALATVSVLEPGAASATGAHAQVERALATQDLPTRLQRLSHAAQLDRNEARGPYQHAVVAFARELRTAAAGSGDWSALQRAHAWLVRAYWESGKATSELRRELDANGAARTRSIAQQLQNVGP